MGKQQRIVKIAVPAGIGDFSWIWSKLSTIPDTQWEIFVPDAYPYRTTRYINLLPNAVGKLGKHDFGDIKLYQMYNHTENCTWKEITKAIDLEKEILYIEANQHLEKGLPLQDWLPDLQTDYHYPFKEGLYSKSVIDEVLLGPSETFGIHIASMRGLRAWKCWLPEAWTEFLGRIYQDNPQLVFVFLGGFWDIESSLEVTGRLKSLYPDIRIRDYTGRTSLEDVIILLGRLDYFFGFSSGLNVIRNLWDKPCCVIWPHHQRKLMYSWVDPMSIQGRSYVAFCYDEPERTYFRVKAAMMKKGI